MKITDIKTGQNGVMVIESVNENEREKIKKIMDTKISDDYEIKILQNPKLI